MSRAFWCCLICGLLFVLSARAASLSQVARGGGNGDDANAVVLEVMLDKHQLSDSLTAYQDGDQFLLPLGELARLLTLAITVNADEGRASGFVIREDRSFGLDVARAAVNVDGREQAYDKKLVRVIGDDVYVAQSLLRLWLPIEFEVDLPTLQLRVKPRVKLPLQERLWRENHGAPAVAAFSPSAQDKGYVQQIEPYSSFRSPFIDQTLGSDARFGRSATQYKTAYAAYVTTDVVGMEGSAYVSASRDKPEPDVRAVLARNDPQGQLLGPMQARSLSVGNIVLPAVPNVLINGQSTMGMTVSNRSLDLPSNFDRHSIRGDLPPGWDVTLYYNDALVGYQPAGVDGRYAFDNLPLSFGPNEFRLVFNGPLGQVRVERQSFLLDQAVIKPGEFFYSLAQQQADGGHLGVAQFDVGLSKTVSANLGIVDRPVAIGAGPNRYLLYGLRGYWSGLILSSGMVRSSDGGLLSDTSVKTRIGTSAVSAEHIQRHELFESDVFDRGAESIRFRDKLNLTHTFLSEKMPPVSVALESARDVIQEGRCNLSMAGRISTMLAGTSMSNSVRTQRYSYQGFSSDGSLQLSRRLIDIGLNGQLDYAIKPNTAVRTLALTADKPTVGGYRVNGGVIFNRVSGSTQVSAGVSKSFGSFAMALSAGYGSNHDKAVGVQFFMALGRDPRSGTWFADAAPLAGTGAVSVQTFVDRNMNGVRDEGEESVPNAGFFLNNGGRHPARTDASGTALLGRLTPGQYADVAVDPATLEDPQWKPLVSGVRVLPRPGVVQRVDFPVVYTAEVEGTVYLVDQGGKRRGIGDARVEAVNAQGEVLASTKSSSDGYYLLHQVLPGKATLRIAPDQARKLHLSGDLSHVLDVPANGDFISGQDFELQLAGVQ